ncbi:hypothetical protein BVC80_1719g59 [Macleaya cordata]|uniref:Branchless trichome n=1 Tax=Macleaya cordata TaxID=56857 RepID=A0A200Q2N8_MACCD|nr:hypothetical protein BVC80_1719g59 [Macleaya cordata]
MEEEMMMLMMIRDLNLIISKQHQQPITTTCTSWKLYENPFYYPQQNYLHYQNHLQHHHHHLHLPVSARKIASSLWDLTFFRSIMGSQLEIAKTQITELKSELEFERKLRKKVESLNKKLVKEISEQRKEREAMERLCEELAEEIASDKAVIDRMKREIEEERKMLRMAEVLREERVQMKLSEAKILLEEKLLELEFVKGVQFEKLKFKVEENLEEDKVGSISNMGSCENNSDFKNNGSVVRSIVSQRKSSPEAENPHIKRGIKGFVEFPRVVKAISSRGRQLGSKLECQKSQLRLLLRQKSPFRANNLIMG